MPETRGPDAWLIEANKHWQSRALDAEALIKKFEAQAAHDHRRIVAERARVAVWRRAAIVAWFTVLAAVGQWRWGWPSWCVFPTVVAAGVVNAVVDYRESQRRKQVRDAPAQGGVR